MGERIPLPPAVPLPQPPKPPRNWRVILVALLALGILFAAAVVANLPRLSDKPTQAPPLAQRDEWREYLASEQARRDAWGEGQRRVYEQLKAPATAKLQAYNPAGVGSPEPGQFLVVGHVDAENSFGAMLRRKYACKLQVERGKMWVGECAVE